MTLVLKAKLSGMTWMLQNKQREQATGHLIIHQQRRKLRRNVRMICSVYEVGSQLCSSKRNFFLFYVNV